MSIENPEFLSRYVEKKTSSKLKKTAAILGSTAAVLMATNAFGGGKAEENKELIGGKGKARIGMSDAGIEIPEVVKSLRNNADVDLSDQLVTDNNEVIGNKNKKVYEGADELVRANGIVMSDEDMKRKTGIK